MKLDFSKLDGLVPAIRFVFGTEGLVLSSNLPVGKYNVEMRT